MLSSNAAEVGRLLVRARAWAERLGSPVRLWLSDKQDAFVKGIATEFAGVPHRYCQNHFLRDLAKPLLEQDSHAKVQMRKQVRGLRVIEREVLEQRSGQAARPRGSSVPPQVGPAVSCAALVPRHPDAASSSTLPMPGPAVVRPRAAARARPREAPAGHDAAARVVLDYCASVRGILNNNQGGPLQPPGLRMAAALTEVQASLQRNLALHSRVRHMGNWSGWRVASPAGYLSTPPAEQAAACSSRWPKSTAWRRRWRRTAAAARTQQPPEVRREYQPRAERSTATWAEADVELVAWACSWDRVPARERRGCTTTSIWNAGSATQSATSGTFMAGAMPGCASFQEGATLVLVLDAHDAHPGMFTVEELLPILAAKNAGATTGHAA